MMRSLLCVAAAGAFLLGHTSALAIEKSATTITYRTDYRQTFPMETAGEVTGVMRLTFAPGDTVNGTYREEFSGPPTSVAGGVHESNIWLTFTIHGGHRFHGVIKKDGTITGTLSNWHDRREYKFTAVPETNSATRGRDVRS